MNLSIYEMLQDVSKQEKPNDKVAKLQEYARQATAFKIVLDLAFNPKWQWLLPPGAPPYNPSPKEADLQHVLKADARRLQYFINTPEGNRIKPLRRETMFIELLEAVDFNDAKLLIAIKDRKLPFNGITKRLVQQAFPNETKDW